MTELSRPGTLLRQADPDRFLTALFAPPTRRDALFTLYNFNNELARARDATREPMMAMIRLQWWREVVDGTPKAHEVATPLAAMLDEGALDRTELHAIIDAREQELDTIPTLVAWQAWLLAGAGGLAVAAGRLLGTPADPRLRAAGAAYAAAGILRNGPALARAGRCLLPRDVLAEHDLSPEAVITHGPPPRSRQHPGRHRPPSAAARARPVRPRHRRRAPRHPSPARPAPPRRQPPPRPRRPHRRHHRRHAWPRLIPLDKDSNPHPLVEEGEASGRTFGITSTRTVFALPGR